MNIPMKFKIGQLVENWACGFGRVTEILSNDAIVVKFSYLPEHGNEKVFVAKNHHLLTIHEE